MRSDLIPKVTLALCLALSFLGLSAAQYRDNQLYVEVLLCSGNALSLTSASGDPIMLNFLEEESPVKLSFQTPVTALLATQAAQSGWTWLEVSDPPLEEAEGVVRESFAWEDSCLVIKRENLVFSEHLFPDEQAARTAARELGIPEDRVREISLAAATVRVEGAGNAVSYLETPLSFSSDAPLHLQGNGLGFSGEFVLKFADAKLLLTQLIPLEEYVAGVVPNEIGSNAPLEAMKAQAVTARTHALSLLLNNRHKKDGYDLCNTTHCQVYKGEYQQNETVRAAVAATQNQVLTINGRIADATYHSCCGGKTDSSKAVWDGDLLPHLSGVVCSEAAAAFDLSAEADLRQWITAAETTSGGSSWEDSALAWSRQIGRLELAGNLGMTDIDHIVISRRGHSGRITDITFHSERSVRLTSEYQIRRAFGSLKSSLFFIAGGYVATDNGGVVIYPNQYLSLQGRGSGHGVGMCQVGALRQAREGKNHLEILSHYYPGTVISENWTRNE